MSKHRLNDLDARFRQQQAKRHMIRQIAGVLIQQLHIAPHETGLLWCFESPASTHQSAVEAWVGGRLDDYGDTPRSIIEAELSRELREWLRQRIRGACFSE